MADGYYRATEQIQQPPPSLPAEIYVNKDFIHKPEQWFPVNSLQFDTGRTTEMYNNSNQYPPGYDNSYQYVQNYGTSYGYQGYGYQAQQPGPPGEVYPQNSWSQPPPGYGQPPPQQPPQQPPPPKEEPKSEAVVQEIQQQKATLTKQREDYVRKAMVLRRELDQLKHQKQELASNDRADKELRSVLKDNEKLQDEINGKLKAILNVIEMLSTIIKDGKKIGDLEAEVVQQSKGTPSPKREARESSRQRSRSPSRDVDSRSEKDSRSERESRSERDKGDKGEGEKRFCYIYYDTGLHWCRACDKFPETAKEFLQHLHSSQHQDMAKENEVDTTPWHKLPVETLLPSYDDAPKKRIPIKGLQFFISAPSWYCKLCDVWIGDLHCASHHLKSQAHFQNYENFVEQNPHWETEWLKDRERAMTRNGKRDSSDSDDDRKRTKRKHRSSIESVLKEKKKKKRSKKKKRHSSESSSSSSSSSDSSSEDDAADKGKSIRVAMRNMSQVKSIINEDMSKWTVLEKLFEEARRKEGERKEQSREPEDELINQWMTIVDPQADKERSMLDSLKDRMRAKQDLEKAKMAELERRRKEKEREELELLERKRKQMREEAERAEKERKRKEQEEFNRILDKDRNHVRFRAARENFRKRKSSSDEEDERRRERSKERSRENTPHARSRKDSEHSQKSYSPERKEEPSAKKKPPGPPSYKKLPFIGRMPLFKKKMEQKPAEKQEIKKEEYEPTRKTRFETGNLTKAFIPKPDVVCFPMLSSIPPISAPPAPTAVEQVAPPPPLPVQGPMPKPPQAPEPPTISFHEEPVEQPKINEEPQNHQNSYSEQGPHLDTTYYQNYNSMSYESREYHYQNNVLPHPPLEPPPLPPDDDLAMLGICADDMAAQSF